MSSHNVMHLVMGVSSSGKSKFIKKKIDSGEWNEMPILMSHEQKYGLIDENLKRECVVHYNMFRSYSNNAENIENELLSDMVIKELLKYHGRIHAYILITHPSELSKRILLRNSVEKDLRGTKGKYPNQNIFELACRLDIANFYQKWIFLLKNNQIKYELINSETYDYFPIRCIDDAVDYLNEDKKADFSDQEIFQIIEANKFEYQKVLLPNGRYTKGQDRAPSLSLLDEDLTGKSLLDIGCAYGYFCFESEKRNAARVVGTELKRHRYVGANIIKEITGNNSEILYQDVFEEPLEEKFDIVILLNVIHHLKEPIRALRMLSNMCTEKLIIEFPTLEDKKYNSSLSQLPRWRRILGRLLKSNKINTKVFDNRLPVIGVSSLTKSDQTFLFSEAAIERILMDHDSLFARIEFIQSPMSEERRVAVCYKL